MYTTVQTLHDDPWSNLQQPAHPGQVHPRFASLLAALDLGWSVEKPVFLRPRWGEDGPRVYHFLLRRGLGTQPRLLSVPEGPLVARFVEDESLPVILW